jgi:hypothetical protein
MLDAAVGSGSVEMTKYLLEFHHARPTRETLKQSISTGSLELIKLMRERLPEGELRDRVELLEVAAEFHQEEVLVWLLRDATVFEQELLGVFALERKVADSLVVALENGFRPWWSRTHETSLEWRASAAMKFVPAPAGFWSDGGWWTALSGATSALRGLGPTLSEGPLRADCAIKFEWTWAMSVAQMGDAKRVKSVVLPPGVTAIGEQAMYYFDALESIVFSTGCNDFGKHAFACCKSLKTVSLPLGCKATGFHAFRECKSLVNALIPAGCVTIGDGCFAANSSLTGVRFPDGLQLIGKCAFCGCSLREIELPDGCEVAKYAFCKCAVLTKVSIGRDCTSIGEWAFSGCAALTKVTVGDGLASIDGYAFDSCYVLAAVTLPCSVRSIGNGGFARCLSLATIAVPNGCQLHMGAFDGCSPRVTRC